MWDTHDRIEPLRRLRASGRMANHRGGFFIIYWGKSVILIIFAAYLIGLVNLIHG